MESKNKKCFRCSQFSRFYTKGVKRFNATKFGWCHKTSVVVCNTDGCEEFRLRPPRPKYKRVVLNEINDLLTNISALRQILEEYEEV